MPSPANIDEVNQETDNNGRLQITENETNINYLGCLGFRGVIGAFGRADCQSAPTIGVSSLQLVSVP